MFGARGIEVARSDEELKELKAAFPAGAQF
jgi:hypothetical protein